MNFGCSLYRVQDQQCGGHSSHTAWYGAQGADLWFNRGRMNIAHQLAVAIHIGSHVNDYRRFGDIISGEQVDPPGCHDGH